MVWHMAGMLKGKKSKELDSPLPHLRAVNDLIDKGNCVYKKDEPKEAISYYCSAVEEFGKYLRLETDAKRFTGCITEFMSGAISTFSSEMYYDFAVPRLSVSEFSDETAKGALEDMYFLIDDSMEMIIRKCDAFRNSVGVPERRTRTALKLAELRTAALLERGDAIFLLLKGSRDWNAVGGAAGWAAGRSLMHMLGTYDSAIESAVVAEMALGTKGSLDFYKEYAFRKAGAARALAESLIRDK